MERGLRFGNVGIFLVLLLLLKLRIGFGSAQSPGSITVSRGPGDGAGVMERSLENLGAPGADVTVEDDETGPAGEADEPGRERNGNVRTAR